MKKLLLLLLGILFTTQGCNRYLSDYIPTVDYRGTKIKSIEPEVSVVNGVSAKLNLLLAFRYTNPYKQPLTIPAHSFTLSMKNRALPAGRVLSHLSGSKSTFQVRAQGDTTISYVLSLDLDPLGQMKDFLGKDNYYEFSSDLTVDLKDYLPGGAIRQGVSSLLGNTSRDIHLAFGDSIRLPLMPIVKPAASPARVQFVGSMESIDFSPLKDGMNPFVSLISDTKVQVYAPTWENPFRTVEVNFADHMMNLLSPVVSQAPATWTNFKSNWTTFKAQPVIRYPGSRVTGLRVTIPFMIKNPNDFAIESPEMSTIAQLNSVYQPVAMEVDAVGSPRIGPGEEQRMNLTWQINWNDTFTLPGFISGQALPNNPTLKGNVNVDIGYGMISLPFSITAPLQLGGN